MLKLVTNRLTEKEHMTKGVCCTHPIFVKWTLSVCAHSYDRRELELRQNVNSVILGWGYVF